MSEQNETFEIPSRGRPKKREIASDCNYTQEPYFSKNNPQAQMCGSNIIPVNVGLDRTGIFDSGNSIGQRAYDPLRSLEHSSPYDPSMEYDQDHFFEKATMYNENSKFSAGLNLEGHDLDLYNGATYDDEQTKYITLTPNNLGLEKQEESSNPIGNKAIFDMPNLPIDNVLSEKEKFINKQSTDSEMRNEVYNTKNSNMSSSKNADLSPSTASSEGFNHVKSSKQEALHNQNEKYDPNIFKTKNVNNDINLQHKRAYNLQNNINGSLNAANIENNTDKLNLPVRHYASKSNCNKQSEYEEVFKHKNFPNASYKNRDGYNPSFHKRNDDHNYKNNQMRDPNFYKRSLVHPVGYNFTGYNPNIRRNVNVGGSSRNMTPMINPLVKNENNVYMQNLKAFGAHFTNNKPYYGQNSKFPQQMITMKPMNGQNNQGHNPSDFTQDENNCRDNIMKSDMIESTMFQLNSVADNNEKLDSNELYNPNIFKQESIPNNQMKITKENMYNSNMKNIEALHVGENDSSTNNIEIDPSVFNQENYNVVHSKDKSHEGAIKKCQVRDADEVENNFSKMYDIFPKKVFENASNRGRAKYNSMPQTDPAHNNIDNGMIGNQQQNSMAQAMSAPDQQMLVRMDSDRKKHHSEDGALYNPDGTHKDAMVDYNKHPSTYPGNLPSSHFMNNNAWIHRKKRRNTQLMWQYAKEAPNGQRFLNNPAHLVLDQDIPPSEKSSVNYIQGAKLYIGTFKKHAVQPEKTVVNHTILPLFLNNSSIYDNSMNAAEFNKIVSAFNNKIAKIDYENVTVQQLKTVMKEFGLNHTGKKIELIDRVKKTVQKIQERQNFYKNNPNNYDNASLLASNEESSGKQTKKSEPFKMIYRKYSAEDKRIEEKNRAIDLAQIAEYEAATGNDWLFF